MHNSALVNLNVAHQAAKDKNVERIFYSSSACMYPEHNQLDLKILIAQKIPPIQLIQIQNTAGKNFLVNRYFGLYA